MATSKSEASSARRFPSTKELELLRKAAHTVRALGVDAIEKAQSGHPGIVLGAADLAVYLFAKVLRHDPRDPSFMGRDRFVLSAGHGSMLLYGLLHLCGYDVSLEDIRDFRQLHSKTPGHPEHGDTPGVETTSGPLGQGVAAGVGMAIGQKLAAARYGAELFDAKVWVLAGDGCIMEGIASEASSLAGTLGLDNYVLIYDENGVSLDGPVNEVMLENTAARYEAYGFRVLSIDGYDYDAMAEAFAAARAEREKPVLIIARTVVGKYAPTKQGSYKAHGGTLGAEEAAGARKAIGWPDELFFVPPEVTEYFRGRQAEWSRESDAWRARFDAMRAAEPEKAKLLDDGVQKRLPEDFEDRLWSLEIPPNLPTRKCSEYALNAICRMLPWVISGSADLSSCDYTWLKHSGIVARGRWNEQQVKFGVREFGMAACAYGMQLHGFFQPAVGTFLVFTDYMRPAIRLAALMKQRVIFVLSHDSVLLAEDGPTHQPVEHLMSLRLIPNLTLIRPCDENEVKAAWATAFYVQEGPVALCFTRQPVKSTVSDLTAAKAREGVRRGAYILYGSEGEPSDVLILATGSEIHAAVGAARILEKESLRVRVVSIPSWQLFDRQDSAYRERVVGKARLRVSVEAGTSLGWQKYIGMDGLMISLDSFGASAPSATLAEYFGFTAESVARRIQERLHQ